MFEYMTAQEAAECWKISVRRVQRVWLIPQNTKKPVDKRRKAANYGE